MCSVYACTCRRVGTAAGDGEDPSGGVNDVWELRGRQSAQQNITDEISTGVADVMDIDRTPELLIYIWQHFFGKKDKQLEDEEQQQQQLAASQSATTSSTVAPAAEQAAAATAAAAAAPVEVPPGVPPPAPPGLQVATLGGGCFWGLEACMQAVKGVVQLQSGYAGGTAANPNYKQVRPAASWHHHAAAAPAAQQATHEHRCGCHRLRGMTLHILAAWPLLQQPYGHQ